MRAYTKLFLSLALLSTLPFSSLASFSDIPERNLNKQAIEYLQGTNVIGGYSDGTYKPDNTINRAEFLKIVIGAKYGSDLSASSAVSLSDVDSSAWFAPYVYKAISEGIVNGYPDGTFKPGNNINLAEALKIVTLTYQIPIPHYIREPDNWFDPYLDAANGEALLNLVASRAPWYQITRGDTATIIHALITDEGSNVTLSEVVEVVDGDTVKVNYQGNTETVRLIGIDTPETVHPYEDVQCYGPEASERAKTLLNEKQVLVELDDSQGERDTYGRLLAYLFLTNGTNVAEQLIAEGYGKEYTYNKPYRYSDSFKAAQDNARNSQSGLWSPDTCNGTTEKAIATVVEDPITTTVAECVIKGNISTSTKEKIYHVPGCNSYKQTVITESKGERWFCSEEEAVAAGWRKALNCY